MNSAFWAAIGFFAVVAVLVALPPRWDPAVRLKQWLSRRENRYPLPDDDNSVFVCETEDGKRFATIVGGHCPHCKQKTKFFAGPRGGMSQNISCEACGWWFNVTAFPNGEGIAQDIGFKSREVH